MQVGGPARMAEPGHDGADFAAQAENNERLYAGFKEQFTATDNGYSLSLDVLSLWNKSKVPHSLSMDLSHLELRVDIQEYRPDEPNPVKFGQASNLRMEIAFLENRGRQPSPRWDFDWNDRAYERKFRDIQDALLERNKGCDRGQIEQMIERLALEHPLGQKALAFQKATGVLGRYIPVEKARLDAFGSPAYSYALVKQRQHLYTQLHSLYEKAGLNPEEAAREIQNALFEDCGAAGYEIARDDKGRPCLVLEGRSTGYYQGGDGATVTYGKKSKDAGLRMALGLAGKMGYEVGTYDTGGVHENFGWTGIAIPNFYELTPEEVLAEAEKIRNDLGLPPGLEKS